MTHFRSRIRLRFLPAKALLALFGIGLGWLGAPAAVGAGFNPLPPFAAGLGPNAVAVADFNGDGIPDLVVSNFDGNWPRGPVYEADVQVFLGNGDGTFQAGLKIKAGIAPTSVAVADFNGDGLADLFVTNDFTGYASVLLGNGDGTFQPPREYPGTFGPAQVQVGDFNGDGAADLAVSNDNSVSILLGNGDGTFQDPQRFLTSATSPGAFLGDVNGDGVQDIITSSGQLLLGNGDGTFQAAVPSGVTGSILALRDVNGDGMLDLVVKGDTGITIFLGNGDSTFQMGQSHALSTTPYTAAVADFNQDGIPDLALTDYDAGNVLVLLGNGDGTFAEALTYSIGFRTFLLTVADFNSDGFPDLVVIWVGNRPSLPSATVLINAADW